MITTQQQAEYAAQANALGKVLRRDESGNVELDENGEPYYDDPLIVSLTAEQIKANNESKIKSLVSEATLEIDILQDAIDADEAEDGDDEKLKNWRKYRVLLRKVDTSVEEMELPEKPS